MSICVWLCEALPDGALQRVDSLLLIISHYFLSWVWIDNKYSFKVSIINALIIALRFRLFLRCWQIHRIHFKTAAITKTGCSWRAQGRVVPPMETLDVERCQWLQWEKFGPGSPTTLFTQGTTSGEEVFVIILHFQHFAACGWISP